MLRFLRDAAVKAGRLLEIRYLELLRGGGLEVREKGKSDFVTKVDEEVESYLKDLLSDAGFPVVGEESFSGSLPDRCIIVDPIDGTRNFLRGNPHFAVNIALVSDGNVICGVTYDPVKKELFEAENGRGAWLNGERIRVSDNQDISRALVAIGLPYRGRDLIDLQVKLYRNIFMATAASRHTGSAALDLAYVACGRYDAIVYFYLSPWDVAPGILLVEEAGGVVEGILGRRPLDGWLVAASSAILNKLREILPEEVLR